MKTLVIGLGNHILGDDGVGAALHQGFQCGPQALAVHGAQLLGTVLLFGLGRRPGTENVAGIAAVGVMRTAFEFALEWAKTYTAGGEYPIIHHQNVGYMLCNMKMKIEAARYLSWRGGHYHDQFDCEGQEIGALSKIYCGELSVEVISDAMKLVGINSYLKDYPLEKCMRDALCFQIYDAGNMGMQRRRVHGMMIHPDYNPMAIAMNLKQEFVKAMHGVDVGPGHVVGGAT